MRGVEAWECKDNSETGSFESFSDGEWRMWEEKERKRGRRGRGEWWGGEEEHHLRNEPNNIILLSTLSKADGSASRLFFIYFRITRHLRPIFLPFIFVIKRWCRTAKIITILPQEHLLKYYIYPSMNLSNHLSVTEIRQRSALWRGWQRLSPSEDLPYHGGTFLMLTLSVHTIYRTLSPPYHAPSLRSTFSSVKRDHILSLLQYWSYTVSFTVHSYFKFPKFIYHYQSHFLSQSF